jgi:hypothetical protein
MAVEGGSSWDSDPLGLVWASLNFAVVMDIFRNSAVLMAMSVLVGGLGLLM